MNLASERSCFELDKKELGTGLSDLNSRVMSLDGEQRKAEETLSLRARGLGARRARALRGSHGTQQEAERWNDGCRIGKRALRHTGPTHAPERLCMKTADWREGRAAQRLRAAAVGSWQLAVVPRIDATYAYVSTKQAVAALPG